MTNTYILQMMTDKDYNKMMMGYMDYVTERVEITAGDAAEAIEKARTLFPEMNINTNYVKSVQEIEAEKNARLEAARLEAEKEAARKAKAADREAKKAADMNMTVEEYKEYKKAKTNLTRNKNELKKAMEEMEELKKRIAYYEKNIAYYEKKIPEMENK